MDSDRGRTRAPRTWLLALLVMALVASLAPATASAAVRTPTKKTADKLAKRLLKKQLADESRQLVEARISEGFKRRNGSWIYLYDDLARSGDVCTANIVVKFKTQKSRTIIGSFDGADCENPGVDGLAFRAASRSLARQVIARERAITRSLNAYSRSLSNCEDLNVPEDRTAQFEAVLLTGLIQATFDPLDSTLDSFATKLGSIGAEQPWLVRGAAAYRDLVDATRALPDLNPDVCTVLNRWAQNDWTAETAPVDFAALATLIDRIEADGLVIAKTARYMLRSGIDRATVNAFLVDGLVLYSDRDASASKIVRRAAAR